MQAMLCLSVLVLVASYPGVLGHGRLWEPPSRSTCWRHKIDGCVPNWTDNELSCGGRGKQWEKNGGKCGVCGDDWSLPQPRANEAGGTYGKGVIVRTYKSGQTIDIVVWLTAAHMGWFEFRLCKNDDVNKIITHECLNKNLLVLEDGTTRFKVGQVPKKYNIRARLPTGLTCSQCVLQWKYHSGNFWGCDDSGNCCNGCPEEQEEFYGCADVEIK